MDVESLRILYAKKNRELLDALLDGALWQDVENQRKAVTEIGVLLQKKLQEKGKVSPAEFSIRNPDEPRTG